MSTLASFSDIAFLSIAIPFLSNLLSTKNRHPYLALCALLTLTILTPSLASLQDTNCCGLSKSQGTEVHIDHFAQLATHQPSQTASPNFIIVFIMRTILRQIVLRLGHYAFERWIVPESPT